MEHQTPWHSTFPYPPKTPLKTTMTQCGITPSELETLAIDSTGWRSTCKSAVEEFEVRRIQELEAKRDLRKSGPPSTSNFKCQICHQMCRSRIGLLAHSKSHSWWWDPSLDSPCIACTAQPDAGSHDEVAHRRPAWEFVWVHNVTAYLYLWRVEAWRRSMAGTRSETSVMMRQFYVASRCWNPPCSRGPPTPPVPGASFRELNVRKLTPQFCYSASRNVEYGFGFRIKSDKKECISLKPVAQTVAIAGRHNWAAKQRSRAWGVNPRVGKMHVASLKFQRGEKNRLKLCIM